jgi:hypothetical protein
MKDPQVKERICKEILAAYLGDNRTARVLGPDGKYTRVPRGRGAKGPSVQEHLMHLAGARPDGSPVAKGAVSQFSFAAAKEGPPAPHEVKLDLEAEESLNATV